MARKKERPKFVHQATTLEYLYCLGDMPKWSQLLYDQDNGKAYNDFLKWLLEKHFFKDGGKISIKRIAEQSGYTSAKISKWLKEIYEDLLELNELKPQLFYSSANVKIEFCMRYFDNHFTFLSPLTVVPRMYESIDFFFIKAKMGISSFWVKDVQYTIGDNETSVLVFLEGGMVNIYREFALSKALFEGSLNFMDIYQKFDFEIDKQLLKIR